MYIPNDALLVNFDVSKSGLCNIEFKNKKGEKSELKNISYQEAEPILVKLEKNAQYQLIRKKRQKLLRESGFYSHKNPIRGLERL